MTRLTALALLLSAPALPAAPVPKDVRAQATHVGKWQNVTVDPKNPAVIMSRGQFWYLGEDGGFTYQDANAAGPPPKPNELMQFDPKSGHMQHSGIVPVPGQNVRLGVFKIDGDRLTINLNTGAGPVRPKGLEPEANSGIWHLQRIEVKK